MKPVPPKTEISTTTRSNSISNRRLAVAFSIAAISDAISIFVEFVPPVEWAVDAVTAVALFAVVGFRWQLLPAIVAEAIPGVAVFPSWIAAMLWVAAGARAK